MEKIKKSGFLLVDKPEGLTSSEFINKLKEKFYFEKIGHTGTLDPFASGLLVLAINKATKFVEYVQKEKKGYQALLELGKISFSYDIEMPIMYVHNYDVPSKGQVQNAILKFKGKQEQIPPEISAKRIKGKRAYDIFRREKKLLNLRPKEIEIYDIVLLNYDFPYLSLYTLVSAGTYIRALARDLGRKLKTGSILRKLRRVSIGYLNISQAKSLNEILSLNKNELENLIIPIDKALPFEPYFISKKDAKKFLNGSKVLSLSEVEGYFKVYEKNTKTFLGVGKIKLGYLYPLKVLNIFS